MHENTAPLLHGPFSLFSAAPRLQQLRQGSVARPPSHLRRRAAARGGAGVGALRQQRPAELLVAVGGGRVERGDAGGGTVLQVGTVGEQELTDGRTNPRFSGSC